MRSTTVRRSALAASVAALALLVTACGGSSDDDGKADEGKAKALTAAELEKAALAQADVKNGKVTPTAKSDDVAPDQVKTGKAACRPLALGQVGVPLGTPATTVKRSWTETAKKPRHVTEENIGTALDLDKVLITLASYEDGGAEAVMKDVEAARSACAGGFAHTVEGVETKILKVAADKAPAGADEAVALTLTIAGDEGDKFPAKLTVTRKGSTIASFVVINLGAAATGKDFPFPAEISDAQLAKLG
ncbi:hypothetical protein ACGFZL_07265 [Streptomyces sp. NPDC048182]|uniref:hypothetical protein n=1 Tax=Streptomyces sp. NPDC048182 TaxID=3365507 RepID=UPI0037225213